MLLPTSKSPQAVFRIPARGGTSNPRWQIFGDGEYKADERFERNSHDSCVASVGVSDCYLVHTTRRLASEPPGIFPIPGLGPVQSVAIRRFDTGELSSSAVRPRQARYL